MLFFWILFICTIIIDRLIKYWAALIFSGQKSFDILPGIFSIKNFNNNAFLFSPIDSNVIIFSLTLLLLIAIIFLGIKFGAWKTKVGLLGNALLIGGALSNLFDRLYWGYVLDYINIANFTVLNFADFAIVAGLIILLIIITKKK